MSRLIDKEAADEGYQRWQPPQMENKPSLGTVVSGDVKASRLTAEQLEKIQAQAYKEAWDEGFKKGQQDGLNAGRAELLERAAVLDQLMKALDQPFEELDAAVEQALVDLAMTLAQALVRRELRTDPGQVVAVVREALAALPVASRHVRVCLHPSDVAVVSDALAGQGPSGEGDRGWRLQEDPSLKRGDCIVRSENSQIDASMEKRLAAVVAQLSGGEREQDAERDAVDTSSHAVTDTVSDGAPDNATGNAADSSTANPPLS